MTYRQALIKVYEKIFELDDQIKEMNKQFTPELLKEVQTYIASEIANLGYEVEGLRVYYTTFNLDMINHKKLKAYKLYESLYTKMHVEISLTSLRDVSDIKPTRSIPYGVIHYADLLTEKYRLQFDIDSSFLFAVNIHNITLDMQDLFGDNYRNAIKAILNKIIKKGFNTCSALKYLKTLLVKKWRMIINQTMIIQEMLDLIEDQLKNNISAQMKKACAYPDRIEYLLNGLTFYFNIFGNELEGYVVNYSEANYPSLKEASKTFKLCEVRNTRLILVHTPKYNQYAQRDMNTFVERALNEEINMKGFDNAIKRMYSTEIKGDQSSTVIYNFLFGKEISFNVRTGEVLD